MSAPAAKSQDAPGFISEVAGYLLSAVVYTSIHFVTIALVAGVITATMLVSPDRTAAGFIFLTFLGWALIFGQLDALGKLESDDAEWSSVTQTLLNFATLLYYNVAVILIAALAYGFYVTGFEKFAVAFALGAPALDIWVSRSSSLPLGFAYLLQVSAVRLGQKITETYDQVPAERIVIWIYDRMQFLLESIRDGIPKITTHLSVNSITHPRRRVR